MRLPYGTANYSPRLLAVGVSFSRSRSFFIVEPGPLCLAERRSAQRRAPGMNSPQSAHFSYIFFLTFMGRILRVRRLSSVGFTSRLGNRDIHSAFLIRKRISDPIFGYGAFRWCKAERESASEERKGEREKERTLATANEAQGEIQVSFIERTPSLLALSILY
jgi:hypothetical protein